MSDTGKDTEVAGERGKIKKATPVCVTAVTLKHFPLFVNRIRYFEWPGYM